MWVDKQWGECWSVSGADSNISLYFTDVDALVTCTNPLGKLLGENKES